MAKQCVLGLLFNLLSFIDRAKWNITRLSCINGPTVTRPWLFKFKITSILRLGLRAYGLNLHSDKPN